MSLYNVNSFYIFLLSLYNILKILFQLRAPDPDAQDAKIPEAELPR